MDAFPLQALAQSATVLFQPMFVSDPPHSFFSATKDQSEKRVRNQNLQTLKRLSIHHFRLQFILARIVLSLPIFSLSYLYNVRP